MLTILIFAFKDELNKFMQQKYLLTLLLFFQIFLLSAQNSYILRNQSFDNLKDFEVLADQNYTFEQILNDKSLHFIKYSGKYDFKNLDYCWLRFSIKNTSSYTQYGYLSIFPMFNNVLYSYNTDTKSWQNLHAGLEINTSRRRNDAIPCAFRANSTDTFFIKMKISQLANQPHKVGFNLRIEQEKYYLAQEQFMLVIWVATLLTMATFFFYNLYLYFIFKDITYLYYLMILVGGITYITAINQYFNIVLPFRIFNIEVSPNGHIYYFDLNIGFSRIGVVLIIAGFIQFTRIYLQLFWQFPFWNKVLKYMLYIFCAIMMSNIFITLSGIYYTDNFIAFPFNIFIILLFYYYFI